MTDPSIIVWKYTLNTSQSAFTFAAPGSDSALRNLALVNQTQQPRPPDCVHGPCALKGAGPLKQCYRTRPSGCNKRERKGGRKTERYKEMQKEERKDRDRKTPG